MDVAKWEGIVRLSQGFDQIAKNDATQFLDRLRLSDDRWFTGLKLFFDSRDDVTRFFGLSLTRDYLVLVSQTKQILSPPERLQIRDAIMSWTKEFSSASHVIQPFLVNNVASIITLLIKIDYPELWESAFSDVLSLGTTSAFGLAICVKVLNELEIEVVAFDEKRTKTEITHNTIIKDAMRATTVVHDIIVFLCQATVSVRAENNGSLSQSCLECLASMIGWVDLGLIICEPTLATIYGAVGDERLRAAAYSCLFELVKKGMDPIQKVLTIKGINLIPLLAAHIPRELTKGVEVDEDCASAEEFGQVVDMVYLELLGCWDTYEGGIRSGSSDAESQAMAAIAGTTSTFLRDCWPLLNSVFNYCGDDADVPSSVVPSLTRLVALLQSQKSHFTSVQQVASTLPGYFLAHEYLQPLLLGIYKQLQFSEDFGFDRADEDDAAVIESKKEIQKLFVKCCRVAPEQCLDLIAFVLTSLPQPFSSAPISMLEAALKLVYSFSECGQQHIKLVNEGTFPGLLTALNQTDIATHPHPEIIVIYYEIVARYTKLMDAPSLQTVVSHMVSVRGLRHREPLVRSRSAYLLFRICEMLEGKASILLPAVGSFAELLLVPIDSPSPLSHDGDLHLLEALGLITSSTYQCGEVELAQQQGIIREMVEAILSQIQTILAHPQLERYVEEMGDAVAHRLSCLCSLTKGFNAKTRPDVIPSIQSAGAAVITTCGVMASHAAVREKVMIFCHRAITIVGEGAIGLIQGCFPTLLERMDSRDCEKVVQLLNQVMVEFEGACVPMIDVYYAPMYGKLETLYETFERQQAEAGAGGGVLQEAHHVELERVDLQKQLLMFLFHVSARGCHSCLTSDRNRALLQPFLAVVQAGLQGGRGNISHNSGLVLRKNSLFILTALARHWASPSESVPLEFAAQFSSLLYDTLLPMSLSMCSDGRTLNVHEVATQPVLAEIGALLWTTYTYSSNSAGTMEYLQSRLLPSLGWSQPAISAVIQALAATGVLSTFRDHFKQFIRSSLR